MSDVYIVKNLSYKDRAKGTGTNPHAFGQIYKLNLIHFENMVYIENINQNLSQL